MSTGSYLVDNPMTVPQWTWPRRGGGQFSGTIVIHTAECAMDLDGADSSAENCAEFIRTRSDYGSYHRLVDSDSIINMVPFNFEAWQDTETNGHAVGLSAAVSAHRWNEIEAGRRDRIYRNLARTGAEAVRFARSEYGITVPIRRITGDEARRRAPGFVAHGDSGLWRSDPGVQFNWNLFLAYVAQELGAPTPVNVPAAPSAPSVALRKVTANVAWVRTGPARSYPLVKHLPEGVANGATLAILGYVKGEDPFKTGDDAWLKTEGGFYVWTNNVGNSIAGLTYLGDMTPKAPDPAPYVPPKGVKNGDKQWIFEKGETLSDAAKYFNVTVAELAKFNGITNVNKIKIGENVWPPVGRGLWTVDPGDTLSKIALYYGVSVQAIKTANGLKSDTIKVGQRLIIL